MTSQIELAKTLPPRLLRFFQRYPPPQLFPTITQQIATPAETTSTTATTATADATTPTEATTTPEEVSFPNPFLPTKNFATGRWHGPVYGLRKQADLVKLADAHGVVDLLPWTIKKPGEKAARRIERGLTVKGTGEGQRVKGKLWERTLKGRLEMRRQAMLDMPRLIQEWKQVSSMYECYFGRADTSAERTWAWVEEVAQRKGEEIDGSKDWVWNCASGLYTCVFGWRAYCRRSGRSTSAFVISGSCIIRACIRACIISGQHACDTMQSEQQQHIHLNLKFFCERGIR